MTRPRPWYTLQQMKNAHPRLGDTKLQILWWLVEGCPPWEIAPYLKVPAKRVLRVCREYDLGTFKNGWLERQPGGWNKVINFHHFLTEILFIAPSLAATLTANRFDLTVSCVLRVLQCGVPPSPSWLTGERRKYSASRLSMQQRLQELRKKERFVRFKSKWRKPLSKPETIASQVALITAWLSAKHHFKRLADMSSQEMDDLVSRINSDGSVTPPSDPSSSWKAISLTSPTGAPLPNREGDVREGSESPSLTRFARETGSLPSLPSTGSRS